MTNTNSKNKIQIVILAGLLGILAIAPFFRGLYFEKELLPAHIASFSLILIWMILKVKDNEYKLLKSPTDILVLGIVFMYFFSTFYGVNKRLAIAEFLKYANYFAIFLLARDLSNNSRYGKWILNILLLSGIGVSVLGIGTAIGTWSYNGSYVGNRLSSTFQYPNTLASYLGAMIVLSTGLLLVEKRKAFKALYGASTSIMMFCLILTYSRGMWLIIPFVLLGFVICIPNKRKLEAILYLVINVIVTIPLSFLFAQRIQDGDSNLWIIFIGAFVLVGIITFVITYIENKLRLVSIKKLLIGLVVILILFSMTVIYMINATTSLLLENHTDKNKWTAFSRNIRNVEKDTEYELIVKYKATSDNEKHYAGRVRVYSLDENAKLEKLEFNNIYDIESNELTVPFTTLDTTKGIRVYLDNYYTGTSIEYKEVKVIDTLTGEMIKNIPLKYKYIPEKIVSRIESINLNDNSAGARIAFYEDGFKIVKENFIFGTGGGGWQTLYKTVQSYPYNTTQAHNYFLQMWIEIGFVGLALFVAFLILLVYYFFKAYRNNDAEENILNITLLISAFSILAHAFLDFDLSLSALDFVLWAFLGVLASKVASQHEIKKLNIGKSYQSIVKYVSLAVLVLLVVGSVSLFIGHKNAQKAVLESKNKNIDGAIEYFEKAIKYDKYKTEYRTDLATLYKAKFLGTKDRKYIDNAIKQINKALQIDSYNSVLNSMASSIYMSCGRIDEALDLMDTAVKLSPMTIENYVTKSNAYLAAFNYYVSQKKDLEKAYSIIQKANSINSDIQEVNSNATRFLKLNDDLITKLGYIQFYNENLKETQYRVGQGYSLKFAYYFNIDANNDGVPDRLYTSNHKEGNLQYEVINDEDNNFIRLTNDGQKYGYIYVHKRELKPDTEYKIFFKARGNASKGKFNFYVIDYKAEKRAQAELKDIELSEDWNIYSVSFTTDSDVKPGNQYLRFQHNGNDDGYIDIEEVVVFEKK